MSNAPLDERRASSEQLSSSPTLANGQLEAVSSNVLVSEGLTTPPHLSFAAATPSRIRIQQVGTITLLIHVVQLLTGESDLTIHTLSSPDYEGAVAFICAVLDNGAIRSESPDVLADRRTATRRSVSQRDAPVRSVHHRSSVSSLLASEIAGAVRPDKR